MQGIAGNTRPISHNRHEQLATATGAALRSFGKRKGVRFGFSGTGGEMISRSGFMFPIPFLVKT
jgi:hypothetical protein